TCGDEDNACYVFSTNTNKTSGAYGAMFKEPDSVNLIMLFNACVQLRNERAIKIKNKFLHQIPKLSTNTNHVINSFLNMLVKFGDISNAENVFAQIKTKYIITYAIIIQDTFEQMPFKPNEVILIVLFKICSKLLNEPALILAKRVFDEMSKTFYQNSALLNTYLQMVVKFGEISNAENFFTQIEINDSINYRVMMNGYNMNNRPEQCLKFFKQMQQKNIVADELTFTIILSACSQIGLLSICEPIVDKIPSNILNHHRLQITLIDMWMLGYVDKALKIFEHVQKPNVMIYTAMINAFGLNGMGYEAVDLYRRMPIVIQNEVTHICVLNACSHSGLIDEAHSIFNNIKVKTERITTTMVDCMSRMFMFDEAQKLIDNFESCHPPGFAMYRALLSGARNHQNFILLEKVFNRMKNLFPEKKQGLTADFIFLPNSYSSVGEDEQAKEVQLKRLHQIGKNKIVGITWTEGNGKVV
ncbi:unnamed protein product, partial [Rotaria sp. Silwood2]